MRTIAWMITIWLLAATADAASRRPFGFTDIGPLRGSDAFLADRVDLEEPRKTSMDAVSTFVEGQLSGKIAPAVHVHPFANTSTAGFQTSADYEKLQSLGAAVAPKPVGTWTSLATAGYTVATAQSRWPYLITNPATGWTVYGATIPFQAGNTRIVSTGTDPIFSYPISLTGSDSNKLLRLKFRRLAGSGWDGMVYIPTTNWTQYSYKSMGSSPAIGVWQDITLDLTTATGTLTWIGGTIAEIRLDFGATAADVFEVEVVSIGATGISPPIRSHLIMASGDLSAYGVDFCNLQNTFNYASSLSIRLADLAQGIYWVERSLTGPADDFIIQGHGTIIRPYESVISTTAPLIYSSRKTLTVRKIGFITAADTWAVTGIRNIGIHLDNATGELVVDTCYFQGMTIGAKIQAPSRVTFNNNSMAVVFAPIYFDNSTGSPVSTYATALNNKGTCGGYYNGNYFMSTSGNMVLAVNIQNNQLAYCGLLLNVDNSNTEQCCARSIIANNLSVNYPAHFINWYGQVGWGLNITGNNYQAFYSDFLHIGGDPIGSVLVANNHMSHANGLLLLTGAVKKITVADNNCTMGNTACSISSTGGSGRVYLGGGEYTMVNTLTGSWSIEGDINAKWDYRNDQQGFLHAPLHVGEIATAASPTIIPNAAQVVGAKSYKIYNGAATSISVTSYNGGTFKDLGSDLTVDNLPVASRTQIEVIKVQEGLYSGWRRIR